MTDDLRASDRPPPGWKISVDARDALGAAGLVLMVGGAAVVHLGLAIALFGLGLFGLAWKLSR